MTEDVSPDEQWVTVVWDRFGEDEERYALYKVDGRWLINIEL